MLKTFILISLTLPSTLLGSINYPVPMPPEQGPAGGEHDPSTDHGSNWIESQERSPTGLPAILRQAMLQMGLSERPVVFHSKTSNQWLIAIELEAFAYVVVIEENLIYIAHPYSYKPTNIRFADFELRYLKDFLSNIEDSQIKELIKGRVNIETLQPL